MVLELCLVYSFVNNGVGRDCFDDDNYDDCDNDADDNSEFTKQDG